MLVDRNLLSCACSALLAYGCAGRGAPPAATAETRGSEPALSNPSAPTSAAPLPSPAPASGPALQAPAPARGAEAPDASTPALPELSVTYIGLHIGGGPNDPSNKQPFVRAIAAHFPQFLDCYRQIEEPGRGGSFGVDLSIPRQGGRARVELPRTTLPGAAFRACVVAVFEAVEFEKPRRPTVISYSLRFNLEQKH